jgi:type VI secretion system Hcp family effector
MGFDAFIKFDGIEGESTDSRHAGWIEIINFDLDVGQRVSRTASSAGGATTERADFSEFGFTKLLDKATPKLTLACAAGTHIDKIVVEICRAGSNKVKFMDYTLTNLTHQHIKAKPHRRRRYRQHRRRLEPGEKLQGLKRIFQEFESTAQRRNRVQDAVSGWALIRKGGYPGWASAIRFAEGIVCGGCRDGILAISHAIGTYAIITTNMRNGTSGWPTSP